MFERVDTPRMSSGPEAVAEKVLKALEADQPGRPLPRRKRRPGHRDGAPAAARPCHGPAHPSGLQGLTEPSRRRDELAGGAGEAAGFTPHRAQPSGQGQPLHLDDPQEAGLDLLAHREDARRRRGRHPRARWRARLRRWPARAAARRGCRSRRASSRVVRVPEPGSRATNGVLASSSGGRARRRRAHGWAGVTTTTRRSWPTVQLWQTARHRGRLDEADVARACLDLLEDLGRVVHLQMDPQVLVVPTQLTEPRRDQVLGHGHARADRQLCPDAPPGAPQRRRAAAPRRASDLARPVARPRCPAGVSAEPRAPRRSNGTPSSPSSRRTAPARVGLGHPSPVGAAAPRLPRSSSGHEDGQHREVGPRARHALSIWVSLAHINASMDPCSIVRLPGWRQLRRRLVIMSTSVSPQHADTSSSPLRPWPLASPARVSPSVRGSRQPPRASNRVARPRSSPLLVAIVVGACARQHRPAQPTPRAGPRRGIETAAPSRRRAAGAPAGAR